MGQKKESMFVAELSEIIRMEGDLRRKKSNENHPKQTDKRK